MDQKKESRKAEEKSGWKGPRGRACTLIVKLWCFIFCDAGPASLGNWAAHDPKTNPLSGPIPRRLHFSIATATLRTHLWALVSRNCCSVINRSVVKLGRWGCDVVSCTQPSRLLGN